MKVFVTGGTGAIGGHAVPALLAAGHAVTALARSPEKAAELFERGTEPVRVSIFDRAGLAEVMAGHAAVVNLATAIPPMSWFMRGRAWRDNDRIRTEGSADHRGCCHRCRGGPRAAGIGQHAVFRIAALSGSTRASRSTGTRWPGAT